MPDRARVLLIEDDQSDAFSIREALEGSAAGDFAVEHVADLEQGLARLAGGDINVVLLDLALPGSGGLDSVLMVCAMAPGVPVVALTGDGDEAAGVNALQAGAQDYIVKGRADPVPLPRAVRFAMGRHQRLEQVRREALLDDLTGLHNRRGFLTLSEQQIKLANRHQKHLLLLFADMDGLKRINDELGHSEGDEALRDLAAALRSTFRDSDILARIGGDEFTVLMVDFPPEDVDRLVGRFLRTLATHNAQASRPYTLSVSLGTAVYEPENPCSIFELLRRADTRMYGQKRERGLARD